MSVEVCFAMSASHETSIEYPSYSGAVNASARGRDRAASRAAILQELVRSADIQFNGARPWDIQVQDPVFYDRVMLNASIGLGDAYMDGHWDSARLDETITRLIDAGVEVRLQGWRRLVAVLEVLKLYLLNRQTPARAFVVGERHYDVGNGLYRAMLDPTMSYSCGYWENASDLAEAQRAKLEMICRKLDLQPGERLLDIGSGWGGLAEYAAHTRGVEVVGVTISREQAALARERCKGLPVEIRLLDYRELEGRFDKIVSVGMFEHVGQKNYREYFQKAASLLEDDGLFLLHTIGTQAPSTFIDPWIDKHIFPNAELPNAEALSRSSRPFFVLEDWHAFGQDYDRTLMAWWEGFDSRWPEISKLGYDERFYRMWKFYLHSCAGFFRARRGHLWQLVLSKPSRREVYRSLR